MSGADHAEALRRERATLLAFARDLGPAQWRTPSAAPGWRVQDVVAHIGGNCHAFFTPAALSLLRTDDIERTNDDVLDRRRRWAPTRVLAEYERWSGRVTSLAAAVVRTPLARVPMPLGELGRFPLGLLIGGAQTFDHHTHLRHDVAPVLDLPAPPTDGLRMATVLAWMLAVLQNALRADPPGHPIALTLDGPGGGTWRIRPDGSVEPGTATGSVARIDAVAEEFPIWATHRVPWRERSVTVRGDVEVGERFLDGLRVV